MEHSLIDNIIYYSYYKPIDIYKTIRHWFYCNFNKEHWNLLKAAFCSYGWDSYFIYNLEEKQIDKQLKWFSHHQIMVDSQYNEIMWSLKIAKKLIHIINNDMDLTECTGHMEFKPLEENPELYELIPDSFECHYVGPYVNTRNYKRFTSMMDEEHVKKQLDNYYLLKVKHLYHLIREKYTHYWSD